MATCMATLIPFPAGVPGIRRRFLTSQKEQNAKRVGIKLSGVQCSARWETGFFKAFEPRHHVSIYSTEILYVQNMHATRMAKYANNALYHACSVSFSSKISQYINVILDLIQVSITWSGNGTAAGKSCLDWSEFFHSRISLGRVSLLNLTTWSYIKTWTS